uniref:Reverse transcriptase domain-containing protein n=1 Tax=Tanacetum cinerariifolium TaxID=118510 RepID=A0A699IQM6_TANCI|nr:hypothetical protein [Tanacetum cinerariifolium]
MLRACLHHGFSELTQIDTFYNGLTEQDQDSLNAASGGNLLNKTTREALKIIENKSKVRYSRSKSNVSRVNTNSRDVVSKTDDRIDKLADQISNLVEIVNKQVIAPAKAVEKTCVTCGGAHAYYDCIATDSNQPSVCAATSSYNQVSLPNRVSHQIPPPGFASVQNNPNRFNQNQGQGNYINQANNFNPGNNFNSGNNFQNNQVPNNQIPPSVPNELSNYIKSNEIAIKSMQNKINVLRGDFNKQEENLRRNLKDKMSSILSSFFQNQPSTLGILSSNTVPNPKGEMKAVTTRSGLTYEGPSIPTESSFEKVDEKNTEEILDKEHSNSSGSTAQVQPSVLPISILEPDDKLFELAKVPLNENCSAMLLKKLPEKHGDPELTPTRMTLELADSRSKSSFNLRGSFLRTDRALIDVYGEDITLRVNDESITFNLNQVIRYYNNSVSLVNVINIACEEDVQDNTKSSSPTLVSDDSISESDSCKEPIVKSSSPTLTPFIKSDFFLEEIENFLKDDSIQTKIENFMFHPEGDILFIKKLLNEYPCQLPPMDLKVAEESKAKSPIEEPEYSLSMGYEHLITTLATELDEVTESSAKNLVPIPSENEVNSYNESEYNEPIKDDSSSAFTTFTNLLFNDKDDFTSNDNESIHYEYV